jgi:protein-S-isoprenylcysteine O-methyltransferase Ste14
MSDAPQAPSASAVPHVSPYRQPDLRLPAARPKSATNFAVNCIGLLAVFGCFYGMRGWTAPIQTKVVAILAITAIPIGLIDLCVFKVHRRESTGLDWDRPFSPDFGRVVTKLLGLGLTIGGVAFAYWVFPEYHGSFYDPYYALLNRFSVALIIITPVYFTLMDGHMKQPKDTYWQLGRLVLMRPEDLRAKDVGNHVRSWLVKGFFLPLMVVYAHQDVANILNFKPDGMAWNDPRLYDFLSLSGYGVDLVFCVFGYILSFRLFDSHVRSAEPTMYGWTVALFCYMPFFSIFDRQYVGYGGVDFKSWLSDYPTVRGLWGFATFFLVATYSLATVAFGWRFSNLTHRGILTGGPYRFTKHPAYVAKNLSWWFVAVPFVSHNDPLDGFRRSICLLCINSMYFFRARTEERHLSRDPVYVQYALWMNEHSMFAWLGRAIPVLQYKPPPGYQPPDARRDEPSPVSAEKAAE